MALWNLTTFDLLYITMCGDHAWIDIHWNNIHLVEDWSHMTSHYTWGPMTTLHDFGSALGGLLDTSFGLSQFHGHGSWLVCEVALRRPCQASKTLNSWYQARHECDLILGGEREIWQELVWRIERSMSNDVSFDAQMSTWLSTASGCDWLTNYRLWDLIWASLVKFLTYTHRSDMERVWWGF